MAIAYGLGRGDIKWSSESSGAIVVSSESCGRCGQQNASKLREAVSWGCTRGRGHTC